MAGKVMSRRGLVVVIWVAMLWLLPVGLWQAGNVGAAPVGEAGGLFTPVTEGVATTLAGDGVAPGGPEVVRERYVTVNAAALTEAGLAAETGETVALNLFADVRVDMLVRSAEVAADARRVWGGSVAGDGVSSVTVVEQAGVWTVSVATGRRYFVVSAVGGGVHVVREVDPAVLPAEAESLTVEGPAVAAEAMDGNATQAGAGIQDDGSLIDMLVVYTDDARAGAGGTTQIQNLITVGINETNQSFANSGIAPRVRLVGMAEVSYEETGNSSTDLGRLQNPSDSYIDEVHTLRNTYGADVVSLIVNNFEACGRGYVMTSVSSFFEAYAFNVVERGCVTPNYSFAHELGHQMGMQHDWYVSPTSLPYPYAHGYAYPAGGWRTIMAYNDYCVASGTSCQRLLYWSNPNVLRNGVPMGVTQGTCTGSPTCDADGRLTLNNTAFTVANFRQAVSAPATPSGLSASDGTFNDRVRVSWGAVSGATHYELWRNTTNNSGTATRLNPNPTVTTVDDISALAGQQYYYWVKGCNTVACSGFSGAEAGYRLLGVASGVSATDGLHLDRVALSWGAVSGATYYRVWRNMSNNSGTAELLAGSPTGTTYDDNTAAGGTLYYYWVQACSPAGCAGLSAPETGYRVLAAAGGVSATDGDFVDKVVVNWNAVSGATWYEVWRHTTSDPGGATKVSGDLGGLSFEDGSVVYATGYHYWVKACNGLGCSGFGGGDTGFAIDWATLTEKVYLPIVGR